MEFEDEKNSVSAESVTVGNEALLQLFGVRDKSSFTEKLIEPRD